ncbi:MAG: hypothetical protein C4305_07995 [Thermoleophilia bacterium]
MAELGSRAHEGHSRGRKERARPRPGEAGTPAQAALWLDLDRSLARPGETCAVERSAFAPGVASGAYELRALYQTGSTYASLLPSPSLAPSAPLLPLKPPP